MWQVINHQFCAFKASLPGQNRKGFRHHAAKSSGNAGSKSGIRTFCKHPDNVTGLCSRVSCPLANSRYATVKDDDGVMKLRIKEIERNHLPNRMWREIKLKDNLQEALTQINVELAYWPRSQTMRVNQRLVRLRQVQLRTRKMIQRRERQGGQTLVTDPKKVLRRERKRETKALRAAEIDTAVKTELLNRLRQGTYGNIYNLDEAFDKLQEQPEEEQEPVSDEYDSEEIDSEEYELEEELEKEGDDALFVEDYGSSDSDEGDVEDMFVDLGPAASSARKRRTSSGGSQRPLKRQHVEVELETEDDGKELADD